MKKKPLYPLSIATVFVLPFLVDCGDADVDLHALPAPTSTAITPVMSCDGQGLNTDPYCLPGARNGTPCTMDCCFSQTCGIGTKGSKMCMCPTGVYEWCICAAPPEWPELPPGGDCYPQGVSNAPPPAGVRGNPCTEEWTTCWTADAGRGCICLRDPLTLRLNLQCGSVADWFKKLDGGVHSTDPNAVKTEYCPRENPECASVWAAMGP